MTTLDDALQAHLLIYANDLAAHGAGDEDRCRECLMLLRSVWLDATEAAAKKCEAQKSLAQTTMARMCNQACDDCAAAIRGKGR